MAREKRGRSATEGEVQPHYRPSEFEVAYLSRKTGRMPIDVRLALMRLGNDLARVEAELRRAQ